MVKRAEYKRPCPSPDNDNQSDLCAQWKAADAARDAADWAWWQLGLSAAGLGGLLYSLYLTRTATKVAVEATEDADKALEIASRNADAATKLAEISESTARAQLRAYIGVSDVRIDYDPADTNKVRAMATLINQGQTPAKEVISFLSISVYPGTMLDCVPAANRVTGEAGSRLFMGKDEKRGIAHSTLIKNGELSAEDTLWGDYTVFVFGYVRYKDIFGIDRETKFRFCRNPKTSQTGIEVVACPSGNEIT
jgi:phage gp46-like protein